MRFKDFLVNFQNILLQSHLKERVKLDKQTIWMMKRRFGLQFSGKVANYEEMALKMDLFEALAVQYLQMKFKNIDVKFSSPAWN